MYLLDIFSTQVVHMSNVIECACITKYHCALTIICLNIFA